MNRVELTKEEAQWFSRNVLKMISLLEAAERKDKEILQRKTYRTLNSMRQDAIALIQAEKGTLMLSRNQKLTIRELVQSVHKTLVERILPEYKRRGGHEKYLLAGEEKAAFLEKLARKFK